VAGPLDDKAFLGVGWAFPVTADPSGEAAFAAHEDDVRQAIQIILGTDPGERVMRPDFGAGLKALVFEPIGASTAALVRHRVEEALVRWEPRIDVLDVSVTDDGPAGNRLLVKIDYRIRSTNTFYNLVYPFYLLEGQPA
jgi:phage baseplate assembly protein W